MAVLYPKHKRGKFIALYGSNNIGKSTQVKHLVGRMVSEKYKTFLTLKYPIYTLEPTGPILDKALRTKEGKISPLEMQRLYAQNRFDFQNVLIEILNSGLHVIAEDYVATGLCWGVISGLSLDVLEPLNYGLIEPDIAILLDGERFTKSIEKGHLFEDSENGTWDESRKLYLKFAKKYNWPIIDANQSEESVTSDIWEELEKVLG